MQMKFNLDLNLVKLLVINMALAITGLLLIHFCIVAIEWKMMVLIAVSSTMGSVFSAWILSRYSAPRNRKKK
jgi:hypothetical protein